MLSSNATSRSGNSPYTVTTAVKKGEFTSSSMSREDESPPHRLSMPRQPSNSDDCNTYREREDVRDDVVPQVSRWLNWNFEQINRFQPSPPPPPPPRQFQPQRAGHQQQYQHRQQPRPTFHRAPAGEAAALRYTSSFPVAQSHQRGGYMQVHPRGTSFEELRSPQEQRIPVYSQATPPARRYEDRRHQYLDTTVPQGPVSRSATTQARPQRRFENHSIRADAVWRDQNGAIYSQTRMSTNSQNISAMMGMSTRSTGWHDVSTHQPRAERVAGNTRVDISLVQSSSSSSREWQGTRATPAASATEMSLGVEQTRRGHSERNNSSSLESPTSTDRATANAKRAITPPFGYRPVVSEPVSKRMRPAYHHSGSATSSLDLLCSATLDLGPLQDNVTGCSCPRSNCIKLYCDCFKAGRRCSGKCSCTNCKNTPAESGANGERTRAIRNILARNPRAFTGGKKEGAAARKPGDLLCNCVKSRCLKLYCECFQKGKLCNDACSCVSCLNTEEESLVGGRRKLAIQQALEKRADAFTKQPKEIGSGCACKNNRCLKKYCDCFRYNLSCTEKCTCKECGNTTTAIEQM